MFKKIMFILIGIMFLSTTIYGTVLDEKKISSITPGDILINKGDTVCKTYEFTIEKIDNMSKAYLQLILKNYIPITGSAAITLKLNNIDLKTIENKNILEKNIIELTNIKENNNLEICIENNYLPRMVISEESTVGNYYVAEITDADFYDEAPTYGYTNTLIPINLFVRNSGYDDVYIEVINASEKFIYNSNLENVSGETSYSGILKAQQTLTLNYFVKTDLNTTFSTPYAQLKYTDRFGIEHIKNLNNKIINIIEPESSLNVHTDISKTTIPNKYLTGNLIIRNTSENTINNIYISPYFAGEIILTEGKINELGPKDVIEIPFKLKTFKEGKYSLNFNVDYSVNNANKKIGSQITNMISQNKDESQNTAITILIIITIILFVWIVKI